ncbi:asparagine synthase-related protein [Jannaschia sp. R86511]|uniref:asparagine synthase-related protein n=1 Tax=Jannaschia sp. R86511 TaxID=3093853 RepID=UPI0036D32E5A
MSPVRLREEALQGLYRPTPEEVATGWLFGPAAREGVAPDDAVASGDSRPGARRGDVRPARAALEDAVRRALLAGPALVAFSGGRDSSAVLALAVHVARRDGLPEPVPVTLVLPGDADSAESPWQDLVLDHLRLRGQEQVDVSDGRAAALGPLGAQVLRAVGHPTFPAGAPGGALLAAAAAGGSLLTGELGDNVLGRRRVSAAVNVWHRRGRVAASDWRTAATDLLPPALLPRGGVDGATGSPDEPDGLPWLRPRAAARWQVRLAAERRATRLHWARDLRAETRRAWWVEGHRTLRAVARAVGAERHDPFADPAFLRAWAVAGGATGPRSRTVAMRLLVGDLLPEAVLSRRSKAGFNAVHFGPSAREVADAWDGGGVDPDLVDTDALRAQWRSPRPHAASLALLQHAWLRLHEEGGA